MAKRKAAPKKVVKKKKVKAKAKPVVRKKKKAAKKKCGPRSCKSCSGGEEMGTGG